MYNDVALSELINAGQEATRELKNMKFKKQTPRMKELLIFRRNQLSLIRKRATELNLTQADLDNIHTYVNHVND